MAGKHQSREDLVMALSSAVPEGRAELSMAELDALADPTAKLVTSAGPAALRDYERFRTLDARGLRFDFESARQAHIGKTVLVTGGTGCIGGALLRELTALSVGRLVSLSRGCMVPSKVVDGVEYRHADIRDAEAVNRVFCDIQPDIVYHLAAQHDPGLAEIEIARTLSTNVTGSTIVMAACRDHGAMIIHASTGKALRPLSRDVYAASKKAAELALAAMIDSGELVGVMARFTHVVDNSIIAERLRHWTQSGAPIRLHSPHVSFYLQSAKEAAHLLICAGLHAGRWVLKTAAIGDLGWPISLMDLALGWLSSTGQRCPVYLCGFEAGYEVAPYPGLYDPRLSGDISPLFNALEASTVVESAHSDNVELCSVAFSGDGGVQAAVKSLASAAGAEIDHEVLRTMLVECGWAMWSGTVQATPTAVLERHATMSALIPVGRYNCDNA